MNVDLVERKNYLNEEYYKNRKIIYGGFKGNMTWSYYLTGFDKNLHPMLESIKSYVRLFWEDMHDDFKSTRFCEKHFFLFENNFSMSFTVRSWGDFMAAVENKGRTYEEFYEIQNPV